MDRVMITGATGGLGGAAAQALLARGRSDFSVLARSVNKAVPYVSAGVDVRFADFNAPESLAEAFTGIDRLLFVSTMSMDRAGQQKLVVDAAAAAGVRHIAYTGIALGDIESAHIGYIMGSHFETEEHIRQSGMAYTFLRNGMYAEAVAQIALPTLHDGVLRVAGGEGGVPYALRSELGTAAANALSAEHENRTYDLVGEHAWTYQDVAQALSAIGPHSVRYEAVSDGEYARILAELGLPPFMIDFTANTVKDIREGRYAVADSGDLRSLLGAEPSGLEAMLRSITAG